MEPEEITTENWVKKLEEFLNPPMDGLSASMREHLSTEGQSAMRTLRDTLPVHHRMTVGTVEEV